MTTIDVEATPTSPEPEGRDNPLADFNRIRDSLVTDFHDLAVVAGNNLFGGEFPDARVPRPADIDRQTEMSDSEKNLLRNILAYADNLAESRFLLGVLGRFKSGKSTVINCLAQADVSPMDTRVTTGVLNFTSWAPRDECIVIFQDGREERIDPDRKVQLAQIDGRRDVVAAADDQAVEPGGARPRRRQAQRTPAVAPHGEPVEPPGDAALAIRGRDADQRARHERPRRCRTQWRNCSNQRISAGRACWRR